MSEYIHVGKEVLAIEHKWMPLATLHEKMLSVFVDSKHDKVHIWSRAWCDHAQGRNVVQEVWVERASYIVIIKIINKYNSRKINGEILKAETN